MKLGERVRVRVAFGLLGSVPVFLAGWLGYVQVGQQGSIRGRRGGELPLIASTADRQSSASEAVPAPRGTIVDRTGVPLAIDRETYDVRATISVPRQMQADVVLFLQYLGDLATDWARAMVHDDGLADREQSFADYRLEFAKKLATAFQIDRLPASGPLPEHHPRSADLLLAREVDRLSVLEALQKIGEDRPSLKIHLLNTFLRDYPNRDYTYGLVGHIDTRWVTGARGRQEVETYGVCGLEKMTALAPQPAAARSFLRDGKGRPYFLAPVVDAPQANVLHTTIDTDLQRAAVLELAAGAGHAAAKDGSAWPQWGALVLVEIATGDVLAAATWQRDLENQKGGSFAPYRNLYEPGSIVKPLVLAYALETGALDWDHEYDCSPGSADYRSIIGAVGSRKVSDDHHCDRLTAHGILVNSSNIGATYVGLGLSREQWHDYMRYYGFGSSLGADFPQERTGGTDPRSFDPAIPLKSFLRNSATSFSFGYELQVNAMQMARAYLRLLRGASAELRLCRGVEVDGQWRPAPAIQESQVKLRPEVVAPVLAAMVDVVSDDAHATGRELHKLMLQEAGIDLHGYLAGKTGTAVSHVGVPGRGKVEVRNASFVGFLPAEAPRWLAVCVLQKDDGAHFYGGSYAGPVVARLLLEAQRVDRRRTLQQDASGRQVDSASPVDSGWSRGAPGKSLDGGR